MLLTGSSSTGRILRSRPGRSTPKRGDKVPTVSMHFRRKFRLLFRRLVFSALVFFMCLVVSEILTRVFYDRLRNYNTEMCRYAAELKKPLSCENLPFHHRPNKEGSFYGVDIKINSLGLRDYEYSIEKPPNKKSTVKLKLN